MKHLVSLISALWVIANLCLWTLCLIPIALLRVLIPTRQVRERCLGLVEIIYRLAVSADSFWMQHIIGIKLQVNGNIGNHPAPIVICNHQSWFDIPVLQEVITGAGPIIKFLVKRELIWVPVIGWICLILDFPRLNRGVGRNARQSDYSLIASASGRLGFEHGALLLFPEGTRFSEDKKIRQGSPYEYLLQPRSGGLKIIKKSAPPTTPIIDLTIIYENGESNFWQCLHGATSTITISVDKFVLGNIDDPHSWLVSRWGIKDRLMETAIGRSSGNA